MAIWNLGSINIDHVYRLPHLPRPGETLSSRRYAQGLGGKGANQSVAASCAGSETHHLGAMGTGDDWVVEQLSDRGVRTPSILRLADHVTGHAIILLDDRGENAIVIHPGANRAIPFEVLGRAMGDIRPHDTLLLQNETNAQVEAATLARSMGARVIYSAAPFDLQAVRAVLPHIDIIAMNAGEADQLFAAIPGLDQPVSGMLITRGSEGAEYHDMTSGQIHRQTSFPVQARDTTGAGDTFLGFFAASLDQGLPIPQALRLASGAAALKVTRDGAGITIPTLAEVRTFLEAQPKE